MLNDIKIEDVLFLDIETVPQCATYDDVKSPLQVLWDKKSSYFRDDDQSASDVYGRAGIYAEFGKIVCISVGFITIKDNQKWFRAKSFYGDDEARLLSDFGSLVDLFCKKPQRNMCAHNGKDFDFPFIARRMLIHGIPLPDVLDVAGKKPWEIKFLDTMELWRFGSYKHNASLALLCEVFEIPTPKDDIDGSMVSQVYWEERDLDRIAVYCEKDILATAQVFLRLRGEGLIPQQNFERVLL